MFKCNVVRLVVQYFYHVTILWLLDSPPSNSIFFISKYIFFIYFLSIYLTLKRVWWSPLKKFFQKWFKLAISLFISFVSVRDFALGCPYAAEGAKWPHGDGFDCKNESRHVPFELMRGRSVVNRHFLSILSDLCTNGVYPTVIAVLARFSDWDSCNCLKWIDKEADS